MKIFDPEKGFDAFRKLFRAIFDLSNKIALLILLRMYALYVKKSKKKQKFVQKFNKLIEE